MSKGMTRVPHNATQSKPGNKFARPWLNYADFLRKQVANKKDLKVEDKRVCLIVDKNYTQEEKAVLGRMCKSSENSRSKYDNELSGLKLSDEFNKGNYYYSIYFFVKQNKFAIDTGNGNVPMVLCSFNKCLKEAVESIQKPASSNDNKRGQ